MEKELSIASCIDSTFTSIRKSSGYNNLEMVAQFMILGDALVSHTKELVELSNQQLTYLSLCMSYIVSSDFVKKYPAYDQWNTGKIFSAVGFYAYMKQLDNAYLLNSHYPAFIALMHEGRDYIADLFQGSILQKKNISPYNPLDLLDFYDTDQKKYDITKHFEYMLHVVCRKAGCSDNNLDIWCNEIGYELDAIEQRLRTKNTLEYAKSMYQDLSGNFAKGIMPDYCIKD